VRTKINQCLKENGPDDVKNFEMPPLPLIHNIDLTKLKQVVLNRLMVRTLASKCNETRGESAKDDTINCIVNVRQQYDQSICTAIHNCRDQNITEQSCRERFDKVHSAVCDCANNRGGAEGSAKELILNGKLKAQFKKCHEENNVTYPEDKVSKVQQAIQQSIKDILARHQQMPPEVKQTLSLAEQALKDIENQWKGAFCAECAADGQKSTPIDSEAELLKNVGGEGGHKED